MLDWRSEKIRLPFALSGGLKYPAGYRNNIIQRNDRSVLHDQSSLRNWQSTIRPHWPRKNWFVKVSFFDFKTDMPGTVKTSDLKIETCRASGPGGQHVNKTDSAVRIVHLPTGIEATAGEERSQTRNRELAMLRLLEKMHLIAEQRHAAAKEEMWLDHYHLERGGAIRTFKGMPPKEMKK